MQKPYPIYDQNGWKAIPFRAAHNYIAHIREYSTPHPAPGRNDGTSKDNLHFDD